MRNALHCNIYKYIHGVMVRKGNILSPYSFYVYSRTCANQVKKHVIAVSSCGANPVLKRTMWCLILNLSICVLGRSMRRRTGINTFLYGCKKGKDPFHRFHCSFFINRLIDVHIGIQLLEFICLKANTEEPTPKHSRNLASLPILKTVTQMHFFYCIQNAHYTQERRCAPVKCTLTYDVLQLLFISYLISYFHEFLVSSY